NRNVGRWRGRAAAVRLDHRHRLEHSIIHGICGCCGVNDFCSGDGSMDWRGRRATLARGHRCAVVEHGIVGTLCARRLETASTVNGEFASMNWPRRRQVAGIKMERVDTDHSSVEPGIRL